MKKNKNKVVSLTLAGAVAVTALLAGTYAWRSISQEATNEARNTLNPGARLHDDFNGMNTTSTDNKVKNVYVENFTSTTNGANVFARIRLDEYLEIGVGAGKKDGSADKNVDVIKPAGATTTPNIDKKETWTTYKWDGWDNTQNTGSIFRAYVDINLGADTAKDLATTSKTDFGKQDSIYYMPTFNKNKDSLEADINGTLAGPDGDKDTDIDAYKDYVEYTQGTKLNKVAVYDADEEAQGVLPADEIVNPAYLTVQDVIDSVVDANGDFDTTVNLTDKKVTLTAKGAAAGQDYIITQIVPANETDLSKVTEIYVDLKNAVGTPEADQEANIRIVKETHEVLATTQTAETAKVITMDMWKQITDPDDKKGNFWVVDTEDGWAYWAAPIEPETATGTLISGISTIPNGGKDNLANKEYYYGLNVVAQFATAGDWGKDDGTASTGFYKEGITSDALTLLNTISGMTSMNDVQTAKADLADSTKGAVNADIVIDGVTYVIVKNDTTAKEALLVAKDVLQDGSNNVIKKDYDAAKAYLEGTFLSGSKTLNSLAVEKDSRAKVFMLGDGDVDTTSSDKTDSVATSAVAAPTTTTEAYWLRTADASVTDNVKTATNTTLGSEAKTTQCAIRPAVWVNYATAAK